MELPHQPRRALECMARPHPSHRPPRRTPRGLRHILIQGNLADEQARVRAGGSTTRRRPRRPPCATRDGRAPTRLRVAQRPTLARCPISASGNRVAQCPRTPGAGIPSAVASEAPLLWCAVVRPRSPACMFTPRTGRAASSTSALAARTRSAGSRSAVTTITSRWASAMAAIVSSPSPGTCTTSTPSTTASSTPARARPSSTRSRGLLGCAEGTGRGAMHADPTFGDAPTDRAKCVWPEPTGTATPNRSSSSP